jgi:hypothetical protein
MFGTIAKNGKLASKKVSKEKVGETVQIDEVRI